MGSDRECRMLGAGESIEVPVKVNDKFELKRYQLRPLMAQHLADLERLALESHKRSYLETFKKNADLLPDNMSNSILQQEFLKVAQWELNDLPQRKAYDSRRIPINEKIRDWIERNFGTIPDTDKTIHALITTALDQGIVTSKEIKEMTGKSPIAGYVRFDQWWVTSTIRGMVSYIVTSICYEHPEVTEKDVSSWPIQCLIEASRKVEEISSAAMGNG